MEFVVDLYTLLTQTYPGAGMAVAGLLAMLLLVWGVKASAY